MERFNNVNKDFIKKNNTMQTIFNNIFYNINTAFLNKFIYFILLQFFIWGFVIFSFTLVEKRELISFNSQKYLALNILSIANIFRNVFEFYIPVRLDYRGRIYTSTEFLTYQENELSKSLLLFKKESIIELTDKDAISYLKIFGANCYGHKLDKQSFINRKKWVDENQDDIFNFENGKLLNEADNKFLFIAFCFEFRKYIEARNNNKESFISQLPIQLDATSNGFQHLSMLIYDSKLFQVLNLKPSTCEDIPDDFYTFIAIKIKDFFIMKLQSKDQNKETLENIKSYTKLSCLEISEHRTLLKQSIMVIPYNATHKSKVEYLSYALRRKFIRCAA